MTAHKCLGSFTITARREAHHIHSAFGKTVTFSFVVRRSSECMNYSHSHNIHKYIRFMK